MSEGAGEGRTPLEVFAENVRKFETILPGKQSLDDFDSSEFKAMQDTLLNLGQAIIDSPTVVLEPPTEATGFIYRVGTALLAQAKKIEALFHHTNHDSLRRRSFEKAGCDKVVAELISLAEQRHAQEAQQTVANLRAEARSRRPVLEEVAADPTLRKLTDFVNAIDLLDEISAAEASVLVPFIEEQLAAYQGDLSPYIAQALTDEAARTRLVNLMFSVFVLRQKIDDGHFDHRQLATWWQLDVQRVEKWGSVVKQFCDAADAANLFGRLYP